MALPVCLDVLLAASLLRLTVQSNPSQIAATALLVGVKRLLSFGCVLLLTPDNGRPGVD